MYIMTIQELYEWATKHNCLNIPIAKHNSEMEIVDVEGVVHLQEVLPNLYNDNFDKVVLD